jgi:hypothetical protein
MGWGGGAGKFEGRIFFCGGCVLLIIQIRIVSVCYPVWRWNRIPPQ